MENDFTEPQTQLRTVIVYDGNTGIFSAELNN